MKISETVPSTVSSTDRTEGVSSGSRVKNITSKGLSIGPTSFVYMLHFVIKRGVVSFTLVTGVQKPRRNLNLFQKLDFAGAKGRYTKCAHTTRHTPPLFMIK